VSYTQSPRRNLEYSGGESPVGNADFSYAWVVTHRHSILRRNRRHQFGAGKSSLIRSAANPSAAATTLGVPCVRRSGSSTCPCRPRIRRRESTERHDQQSEGHENRHEQQEKRQGQNQAEHGTRAEDHADEDWAWSRRRRCEAKGMPPMKHGSLATVGERCHRSRKSGSG
jgi:hypothetical protein